MPSYKDLVAQRQTLDAQIEAARKSEIHSAVATVRSMVAEFGLTSSDVFPAGKVSRATKGAKVAPKYRDPASGATWTGRGKPPLWIAGKDRTGFEIQ